MYSESGITEDGSVEVIISQACLVESNLLVGETIEFPSLKTEDGNPIKLKIVGVFTQAKQDDFYWQVKPEELYNVCFMKEEVFRDYFTGENAARFTITCSYYSLFEYKDLLANQVEHLQKQTLYLSGESAYRSTMTTPEYLSILEQYQKKQTRIDATSTETLSSPTF